MLGNEFSVSELPAWDGTPRASNWLDWAGAEHTEYNFRVAHSYLVGCIRSSLERDALFDAPFRAFVLELTGGAEPLIWLGRPRGVQFSDMAPVRVKTRRGPLAPLDIRQVWAEAYTDYLNNEPAYP